MRINTAPRKRNSDRQNEGKRVPGHLQWIRGRACLIDGIYDHRCEGRMHAHHVNEGNGGMGVKCPDWETVPLCEMAHEMVHRGKRSFEAKYGVNLADTAKQYAKASPHRSKWEQ